MSQVNGKAAPKQNEENNDKVKTGDKPNTEGGGEVNKAGQCLKGNPTPPRPRKTRRTFTSTTRDLEVTCTYRLPFELHTCSRCRCNTDASTSVQDAEDW